MLRLDIIEYISKQLINSRYFLVSNNARIRVKLHFQIVNAFYIFCRTYSIQLPKE